MSKLANSDLVTLDVGFSSFRAEIVVARCRADGIKAHFLPMDENGLAPGRVALFPHRILVERRHAAAVRSIIDQIEGIDSTAPPELGRVATWLYRLIGRIRI